MRLGANRSNIIWIENNFLVIINILIIHGNDFLLEYLNDLLFTLKRLTRIFTGSLRSMVRRQNIPVHTAGDLRSDGRAEVHRVFLFDDSHGVVTLTGDFGGGGRCLLML